MFIMYFFFYDAGFIEVIETFSKGWKRKVAAIKIVQSLKVVQGTDDSAYSNGNNEVKDLLWWSRHGMRLWVFIKLRGLGYSCRTMNLKEMS